jgi:flavin reductase (DIM6/NTAB) family NADH-FMN oxidoreductase RutF
MRHEQSAAQGEIRYGLFAIVSVTAQCRPAIVTIAVEFDSDMRHLMNNVQAFSVNMPPARSARSATTLLTAFPINIFLLSKKPARSR